MAARKAPARKKAAQRTPAARWTPPPLAAFTPAQKATYDMLIAELKNNYDGGPFPILLGVPGVAEGALRILRAYRHEGRLERRLYELAVLVVARDWNSGFEWNTHEARAVAAGLAPQAIARIRAGARPTFKKPDERTVHAITRELSQRRRLTARSYQAGFALFGNDGMVELITIVGFYTMLAMTLTAFGDRGI